jgi:N-acetylmuramoyl-L-alanine amidase
MTLDLTQLGVAAKIFKRVLMGLVVFLCLVVASGVVVAEVEIQDVRYWTAPDHTRIVIDLSGPTAYEFQRISDPDRVAINIPGAVFSGTGTILVGDPAVARIRRNVLDGRAQVVLDLTAAHQVRHFTIQSAEGRSDRIVIDVERPLEHSTGKQPTSEHRLVNDPEDDETFVIVVDPGHGGLDPGAIRQGLREKDLVLDIALELARLIDAQPGYRAALTRSSDHGVKLGKRIQLARDAGGDLFISVHVNTHASASVSGMEVYFLALQRAEDREARELADRENASLMVGVPPGEVLDDDILPILMDLRMSQILTSSNRLADQILASARRSEQLKARSVKQAVFHVLQSLAMPSALVETAYLSNPQDRTLLASPQGRRDIAASMFEGIFAYLGEHDPNLLPQKSSWSMEYRVRSGDTLWKLARRHKTSVQTIKDRNQLTSDRLQVGQTLKLP